MIYKLVGLDINVYTDVAINVDPNLSVQESWLIAKKVEKSLREHVPLLEVVIVRVCPEVSKLV